MNPMVLLQEMARRSRNTDLALRRLFATYTDRPAADPFGSKNLEQNPLNRTAQLLYGVVVDTIPYCNWYRVQVEGLRPVVSCTALAQTGLQVLGVREYGMYPPGTRVWLIQHADSTTGLILGAEPIPGTDGRLSLSDDVSLASRCGLQADSIHQTRFQGAELPGITDWSCHRPNDSLTQGEKGWMAETGVGLHVDSFMTYLRADENCGIWAFYPDQLLRLAGHHLQIQTAGGEREGLDDEGEWNDYTGSTPYPWEALGGLLPNTPVARTLTPEQTQLTEPWYRELEPRFDDQQAFHRLQTYEGYLGQGWRRYLTLPPPDLKVYRYALQPELPGVFDERIGLDGTYALRSARRITIAKRPPFPVPKRRRRAEDTTGDSPDNYRSAGYFPSTDEEAEEHKITSGLRVKPRTGKQVIPPPLVRATNIDDEHAHLWNWHGDHSFYYHEKDFHIPESKDTGGDGVPPGFLSLSSLQWLREPPTFSRRVDHRFKQTDYYRSHSFLDFLPDGGLVLGDGYGAEIRMSCGTITISAPGDVCILPGRNLHAWAGRDIYAKAQQNIELSAAKKSVRIKAEEHLLALAGNGGTGTILLENRAPGVLYESTDQTGEKWRSTGSISIKSLGDLTCWSGRTYLRTGGDEIPGGDIILDAARGQSRVVITAGACERFLGIYAADYFGSEGNITKANFFSAGAALLDTALGVNGVAAIDGTLVTNGSIFAAQGHIFTAEAQAHSLFVGVLSGIGLDQAQQFLDTLVDDQENDILEAGVQTFTDVLQTEIYEEEKPGNDVTIAHAYFSFRTTPEYRTKDLVWFEVRWQMLQRQIDEEGHHPSTVWEEPPVLAAGTKTYPWPGKDSWEEDKALQIYTSELYDPVEGHAIPRDPEDYGDPEHPDPKARKFKDGYLIVP